MSGTFHKNKKVKQKFLTGTPWPIPMLPIFLSPFTVKFLKRVVWITVFTSTPPFSLPHTSTWLLSLLCHWNCSHRSQQPMSCPMQRLFLFSHLTHPQRSINKHCRPLSPWNALFSHAGLALSQSPLLSPPRLNMETLGTLCPFPPPFSTFSLAELTRLGFQHHGFKSLLYAEWLTLLCLQPRPSLEFHCECLTWHLAFPLGYWIHISI